MRLPARLKDFGILPSTDLTHRAAVANDADAIARVFSPSLRLLTFLPEFHTVEEDRWFIANIILKECEVTVAENNNSMVSFLARQDEEIRLLYTQPDFIGRGAGSLLLDAAKRAGIAALELWCFQSNVCARQFYEARGFRPIKFTDGQHNEEKTPDIRYRWERSTE